MFSKKITDCDAFTEMSSAAQALYFHLNQCADDDGFNNQVGLAMFKAHASTDDLKILMAKNYVIRFENGVIVIKHWRLHNTLRKDRYTPTNYQEELKQLGIKKDGIYTLGCQMVAEWLPQNSIDKESIVEESRGKKSKDNAENPLDVLPEGVRSAFDDFAKMRKIKLKKPMTDNAVKRMLNKLNSLSTEESIQIAILNQSEDNCWLDIYPLKTDKPKQQKGSNPFLDMVEEGVFDE